MLPGGICALDLNPLTIGNISEMAEHRALLGIGNFRIQSISIPDRIHKILEVGNIAQLRNILVNQLTGIVVNSVTPAVKRHGSAIAINANEGMFLVLSLQATTAIPTHPYLPKIIGGIRSIGRLLIVVKVVSPTRVARATW